jgi:hypothetical protein
MANGQAERAGEFPAKTPGLETAAGAGTVGPAPAIQWGGDSTGGNGGNGVGISSSGSAPSLLYRPLRFTAEEADRAVKEWGFNCGPGALCAVLGLTPEELRPLMGDFESKGYTNPTLMKEVLRRAGAAQFMVYRADKPGVDLPLMSHGVVRVQWNGPWTRPGVPMSARYRQTHWIAVRANKTGKQVFDINALGDGRWRGWIPYDVWAYSLVPWLIGACVPKGDGGWWPTHGIEVVPNSHR